MIDSQLFTIHNKLQQTDSLMKRQAKVSKTTKLTTSQQNDKKDDRGSILNVALQDYDISYGFLPDATLVSRRNDLANRALKKFLSRDTERLK